eukprot:TRINITY_DN61800_c0_g1_i1.p1 TRINITY_DN61800_c0_g1~~TRINITY_DN61800_c0_g1_i1.p1  ORF type:complete len:383 (-),score=45.70 TRINITY_DN61800_c0_g1_i1:94-1242(-)
MLRLGLGAAHGDDRSNDCDCNELPAGQICGVPIKFSIYVGLFFLITLDSTARQMRGAFPVWVIFTLAAGSSFILFLTILVHEFGHGLTAKFFGGRILYILLWPLGGLCFLTMPPHFTKPDKLKHDWWVTFNGPCTHLFMTPLWVMAVIAIYRHFEIEYTSQDFLSDINPWGSGGSMARYYGVMSLTWEWWIAIYLCIGAVNVNIGLFLFNMFFPMYPIDSSKLFVTGIQICGVSVRTAAWLFIVLSGICAILFMSLGGYHLYLWTRRDPTAHDMDMLQMGFLPIPPAVAMPLLLGCWGGKQTWEIFELAHGKRLHTHPLFSHVDNYVMSVRDEENGRPVMVQRTFDRDDEVTPARPQPSRPPPTTYGAVRLVNGVIVRDRQP